MIYALVVDKRRRWHYTLSVPGNIGWQPGCSGTVSAAKRFESKATWEENRCEPNGVIAFPGFLRGKLNALGVIDQR